jgi:hypothetical protein
MLRYLHSNDWLWWGRDGDLWWLRHGHGWGLNPSTSNSLFFSLQPDIIWLPVTVPQVYYHRFGTSLDPRTPRIPTTTFSIGTIAPHYIRVIFNLNGDTNEHSLHSRI